MKFLECPTCKKTAVKIWQLFVVPSPFWLLKRCQYCQEHLKYNWHTIMQLMVYFIVGQAIAFLFKDIAPYFIRCIIFIFVTLVPLIVGKRLFCRDEGSP